MKFNFKKKFLCLLFSLIIILLPNSNVFAKQGFTETISPGVVREEHIVDYDGKSTVINLLKCDLTNPYLNLSVVAGKGKYTKRATVSEMANATDATALVNGDFFNMILQGSPEGPSIIEGKLQSSPCVYTGLYSLGITSDNTAMIEQISFSGKVTAPNGKSYPIDGLNKSYYWYEPTNEYSHQNKIQLYNDFWASKSRGDKKNTEILVNSDGVIEKISESKNFDFSVPDGKYILQVEGKAYEFIKSNVKIGDKINIEYAITPDKDFKFLIGGHALLVDNGEVVKYTKDINVLGGVRARTAAGISQDGKTLYIASAEGRTKRSSGLKLSQLSDFMKSIGAYKALNLDGGGSTAMVLKNLGEFERTRVINPERNAGERKVVSGIGIFNTAPDSNVVAGVKIKGPNIMVVGESAEFGLGGAWNENLKPIKTDNLKYSLLGMNQEDGTWNENLFLALVPGEINLILSTEEGISATKKIEVKDFNYIEKLIVSTDKKRIAENETLNVTTKAILKNKKEVILSPRVLAYALDGFNGEFDQNGNLKILSFNGKAVSDIIVNAGSISSVAKIYDHSAKLIKMNIDKKSYMINEENKTMDSAPFIKNDRTFVPVRFIVEGFGGDISYDETAKTVNILYADKNISIPLNEKYISINGNNQEIDAAAFIKDGRTFVPIRFIAEALGMDVSYEGSSKTISILEIPNNAQDVIPQTQPENVEHPKTNSNKNTVNKNQNSTVPN
ncbi:stalk domain-containing protein, partial [Peptoniphilus mikwangii]|uniref:stalk domain-containing protein n=1 Tax=Peptoniphilus mikwangii TaxID=1354300 RepID=UPI000414604D